MVGLCVSEWFDLRIADPGTDGQLPAGETDEKRGGERRTTSAWNGRIFKLPAHLERLALSLRAARIPCPLPSEELRGVIVETARRCGLRNAYIQTIVTRGEPSLGVRDLTQCRPGLIVFTIPYVWILDPEHQRGLFTWPEWAAALADEIKRAQADGDPDTGETYYRHWLAALERLVADKGVASRATLARYAWDRAAGRTPHRSRSRRTISRRSRGATGGGRAREFSRPARPAA